MAGTTTHLPGVGDVPIALAAKAAKRAIAHSPTDSCGVLGRRRRAPRPRGSSPTRPNHGEAYVYKARAAKPRRSRGGTGVVTAAVRSHGPQSASLGQLKLDIAIPPGALEAPRWIVRLALACGADAYAGVPLWSGAQLWARVSVPVAYALRYKEIRATLTYDRVGLQTLVRLADARAQFADGRTGRHCRPTNETLAAVSGLEVRTVQRAGRVLKALGCATEILRGRQRTKKERLASWSMGDRSRGWASVWALHPPVPVVDNSRDEKGLWEPVLHKMSPHPRRGFLSSDSQSFSSYSPTENDPQDRAGHGPPIKGGATRHSTDTQKGELKRRRPVDEKGRFLALRWRTDGRSPAWVRRHSNQGWAAVLAGPAAHGWTPEDLNALIREWVSVGGNFLPTTPHKPIALLYTILKGHGDLANRPAADAAAQAAADHAADLAATAARHAEAVAAVPASTEGREAAKALFAEQERARKKAR